MILQLLLWSAPLWAQTQVITVTAIQGTVEVESPSGFHKLAEGTPIEDGQTLRTLGRSTAILAYANGTRLKLNADSTIKVQKQTGLELLKGAVFAHVQKEKQPHFYIKTRAAIAGVRGTDFFTAEGAPGADGWLCVKEGEVEVKPVDNNAAVIVKAGLGIVIKPGAKIEAPKPYAWTKNLNWNMDPGKGEVMDKTSTESIYTDFLKHNYD